MPARKQSFDERFWPKVEFEPNTGCWLWNAYTHRNGYGCFQRRGAHRVAYENLVGPVQVGLELDHKCRQRCCVNPDHLEPVTHRENVHRSPIARAAINASKTHCAKGHPYDEENTIVYPAAKQHGRYCAICKRDSSRKNAQLARDRKKAK